MERGETLTQKKQEDQHATIRVPKDLAIEVDKMIGKHGFRSRAEIAKEAIRHLLSEYIKITVTEGQGKVVTIGEYEYAFTYDHNTQMFAIATDITILPPTYKTTVGATYDVFGLEIQVSEVHDSYCILLLKSTVP
jgi:metal-responsive CopG/Arc/MetJ family transcriptional regulator